MTYRPIIVVYREIITWVFVETYFSHRLSGHLLLSCHSSREIKPCWQTGQTVGTVRYIETGRSLWPILMSRLTQWLPHREGRQLWASRRAPRRQVACRIRRRHRLNVRIRPDTRSGRWSCHPRCWARRSAQINVQHVSSVLFPIGYVYITKLPLYFWLPRSLIKIAYSSLCLKYFFKENVVLDDLNTRFQPYNLENSYK